MDVREELRKLKPTMREGADKLWKMYLMEDTKGRKEIEEMIPIFIEQALKRGLDNEKIVLPPPSKEQAQGKYVLGDVEYGDKQQYPFGLRENEWIQHVTIFGRTGSGKTNLVYRILNNFIENDKPFMVFDWKRNYRDMVDYDIKIFTIGRDVSPFRFNPLIPPPGTDPEIWMKKLVEIISHAYFLGDGVIYLLNKTIDAVFHDFGVYIGNVKKWPTMNDVLDRLYEIKPKGRQSLWLSSTIRAVYSLCFGETGKVFCTDEEVPIWQLLEENVILELDSLTKADKVFFIESLLLWIYHYRMAEGKREEFKHAIILEEAHHVLLKRKQDVSGEETITDIIVREIREMGESLVIVDQHPSMISPTTIGNTFCTICLNMKHGRDIDVMKKTMLIDQGDWLNRLPIGSGIVKLQGRGFDPFLVKIPLFSINKGTVKDNDVRKRMQRDFSDFSLNREGQRKRGEISGFSGSDKLSEKEQYFIQDIIDYPVSPVTERYERLGLNYRDGNTLHQFLITKSIIKPIYISIGKSRIKLFEFTSKGKEVLRFHGIKLSDTLRWGGVEHKYWVERIGDYFESKGYRVVKEKKIGGGRSIDLVVEKDGKETCIEVETGKSYGKRNIQKCVEYQEKS